MDGYNSIGFDYNGDGHLDSADDTMYYEAMEAESRAMDEYYETLYSGRMRYEDEDVYCGGHSREIQRKYSKSSSNINPKTSKSTGCPVVIVKIALWLIILLLGGICVKIPFATIILGIIGVVFVNNLK